MAWRILIAFCLLTMGLTLYATADTQKYWIDHALDFCNEKHSNSDLHSALAHSDTGQYWCSSGNTTAEVAKKNAINGCVRNLPPDVRQLKPCKVVWLNGRITDKSLIERRRRDFVLPVIIEGYDAGENKRWTVEGSIITSKYTKRKPRPIEVIRLRGTKLCRGTYQYKKSWVVRYELSCFNQTFTGRKNLIESRRWLKVGSFLSPYNTLTLKSGNSYIRIRPDIE